MTQPFSKGSLTPAVSTGRLQVSDYIFPLVDGSAYQVLQTDGDGHLYFGSVFDISGVVEFGLSGPGGDGTIIVFDGSGNITYTTVVINEFGDISGAVTINTTNLYTTEVTAVTVSAINNYTTNVYTTEVTAVTISAVNNYTTNITAVTVSAVNNYTTNITAVTVSAINNYTTNITAVTVSSTVVNTTNVYTTEVTAVTVSAINNYTTNLYTTDITAVTISATTVNINNYTLPPVDGSSNQIIVTDGSGNLTFINVNNISGVASVGISGVGNEDSIARWDASGNLTYSTVYINDAGDISGVNSLTINDYTLPLVDGCGNTVLVSDGAGNTYFQRIESGMEKATVVIPEGNDIGTYLSSRDLDKVKDLTIVLQSGNYTGDFLLEDNQKLTMVGDGTGIVCYAFNVDFTTNISGFGSTTLYYDDPGTLQQNAEASSIGMSNISPGQELYTLGTPGGTSTVVKVLTNTSGSNLTTDAIVPGTGTEGALVFSLPTSRWSGRLGTGGNQGEVELNSIYLTDISSSPMILSKCKSVIMNHCVKRTNGQDFGITITDTGYIRFTRSAFVNLNTVQYRYSLLMNGGSCHMGETIFTGEGSLVSFAMGINYMDVFADTSHILNSRGLAAVNRGSRITTGYSVNCSGGESFPFSQYDWQTTYGGFMNIPRAYNKYQRASAQDVNYAEYAGGGLPLIGFYTGTSAITTLNITISGNNRTEAHSFGQEHTLIWATGATFDVVHSPATYNGFLLNGGADITTATAGSTLTVMYATISDTLCWLEKCRSII